MSLLAARAPTSAAEREAALAEAEARLGRALTAGERRIDVVGLDRDLREGKRRLAAAIAAEQLRAAKDALEGLPPAVGTTAEMEAALRDLYEAGRRHALDEVAAAGKRAAATSLAENGGHGPDRALAILQRMLPTLSMRLEVEAAGFDLGEVAREEALSYLSRVPGALDVASYVVSPALADGLSDVYSENAGLFGTWVYTAVMDPATCESCDALDGQEFESWEEIQSVLPDGGPNPDCLGDSRCRCRPVPGDEPAGGAGPDEPAPQVSQDELAGMLDASPGEIAAAAGAQAATAEPLVTSALDAVAADRGATLGGLDFRFKTEASMARKIEADAAAKGVSNADSASQIVDALRYTMQLAEAEYAAGSRGALADLEARGYRVLRVKNYWTDGPYKGVNAVLETPGGYRFELQFHTEASLSYKEKVGHALYERWRVEKDPAVRRRLWDAMLRGSNGLPRPPGVRRVGELQRQGR